MNNQLMYLMAEQHTAELRRAGERGRLASGARAARRKLRQPNLITGLRADPRGGSPLGLPALELEPIASKR